MKEERTKDNNNTYFLWSISLTTSSLAIKNPGSINKIIYRKEAGIAKTGTKPDKKPENFDNKDSKTASKIPPGKTM